MTSKNWWATITSRLFLSIALVAFVLVGYGLVKATIRRVEIEREIAILKEEINEHRSKSEQLTKLLDKLGTEEYREWQARVQLGLQKPGETVVVIQNQSTEDKITTEISNTKSNWQRWWEYFFK